MPPMLLTEKKQHLYPALQQYVAARLKELNSLPQQRTDLLQPIADYLKQQQLHRRKLQLLFACTHNARRSMLSQLWAQTAASVMGIKNFRSFSAGTQATALHPNTVAAMQRAGFKVSTTMDGHNPIYNASYSPTAPSLLLYSKTVEKGFLPQGHFAAVLTCSQEAESCPVIPGADACFPLTYTDPGSADNTPQADEAYDAVSRQIAVEMLWLFQRLRA
ncbi:MAG: hypothetical protein RMK52_06105 [Chitinophagales bacterium]|nr:hypothetical protein [Chitinophagales bacterium]MDW8393801.1 hypothetical protein [Chitinophagales bacterium]